MMTVADSAVSSAADVLKQMSLGERNELVAGLDAAARFVFDALLPSWGDSLEKLVSFASMVNQVPLVA